MLRLALFVFTKTRFKKIYCIRRELIEIYFKKGTKFIVFMPVKFLASIAG